MKFLQLSVCTRCFKKWMNCLKIFKPCPSCQHQQWKCSGLEWVLNCGLQVGGNKKEKQILAHSAGIWKKVSNIFEKSYKSSCDCICDSVCEFVCVCILVCVYWSLGHTCVSSTVNFCNKVTYHMSHVTCQMLMLICGTCSTTFFSYVSSTVSVVIMSHATFCMSHITFRMSHVLCQKLILILGTCWTTLVFMCELKSEYGNQECQNVHAEQL